MLHSEYHNHNPKIKQTRQFFPSPEQFDFWGYVFVTYHPQDVLNKIGIKNIINRIWNLDETAFSCDHIVPKSKFFREQS